MLVRLPEEGANTPCHADDYGGQAASRGQSGVTASSYVEGDQGEQPGQGTDEDGTARAIHQFERWVSDGRE
jgi:hypothetical protein